MSAEPTTREYPATDDTVLAATSQDINEVRISGSVMDYPKIIQTPAGHRVATFRVTTLRSFNQNGHRREQFESHFVAVWDKLVHLVQDLRPGNRVSVLGGLHTYTWMERRTGVKQSRSEIVGENVIHHH